MTAFIITLYLPKTCQIKGGSHKAVALRPDNQGLHICWPQKANRLNRLVIIEV
jgi:hypothetical protein